MAIADKVDVAPAKPDGGNLIAILAEHWPAVFISEAWRPHKPLQVGIRHNLITAGLMKPWEIGARAALLHKAVSVPACGGGWRPAHRPRRQSGRRRDTGGSLTCASVLAALHAEATAAAAARAALKAERRATKSEREASKAAEGRAWIKARRAARKAAERVSAAPISNKAEPVKTPPLPPAAPRRLGLADLKAAARHGAPAWPYRRRQPRRARPNRMIGWDAKS